MAFDKSHLFEIVKIVEGAANADYDKVAAYSRQLCERLEASGEKEAARRLRQILTNSKVARMGFARGGTAAAANGATPPLPVDAESRLTTADEERPMPGEVELFLDDDARAAVDDFLAHVRAADELIAGGVGIAPSMLVYGPPGCGKTQLARFVAAELGLPLITARIDGLVSSYLGSTAKNIRQLFDHATSRPSVLFLDEFDAIAKMRDDARELGELKRVVISLLQNIDAAGKDHVLVAATNHDHLLDPAIWRRFSYRVRLAEPGPAARAAMVRRFFRGHLPEEDVAAVAELAAGMTGAQIRFAADHAVRRAILQGRGRPTTRDAVADLIAASARFAAAGAGLADRLKALREASPKVFTQATLARLFGVSQGQVSKLLKGA